jgi:hypothetical protein
MPLVGGDPEVLAVGAREVWLGAHHVYFGGDAGVFRIRR